MTVNPAFRRSAALCWMLSSATTLCLIFLPRFIPAAPDFDAQARLLHDPAYMTRVWVALLHPLVVLMGALGVLAVRWRAAAGSAGAGFVFYLLWAGTEAVQQSLTLVALNWTWRAEYAATTDAAARDGLRLLARGFDAVWDGLFFFLVLAFIAANVLYLVAVWGGGAFQRVVAVCFGLGAALGVISIVTSFGGSLLPPAVMGVLYPTIQPAGRFLTGLWLWRAEAQADVPFRA